MVEITPQIKRRALAVARWLLPAIVSAVVTAFVGWGSVQYAKGDAERRLQTVEQSVRDAKAEHDQFIRRDSFQIVLDDLKEIKRDVRAVRYGGAQVEKGSSARE